MTELTRRQVVKGIAATGVLAAIGNLGLVSRARAAKKISMGFIYVGSRDDFGYNQSHFEGKSAVSRLPWVTAVDEEKVPESIEVQKTMESMIHLDGTEVLFPTSFGYFDPHILKMAKKYPNVIFLHCGGLYREGAHPTNVGSYFGYIDEAQYVAGILAGGTSQSGKLGFVAAKPIPLVLRNVNAFTLGAQTVNPRVTTHLIFTGDWALPVREAEATNSLIDQGIDVVTCHVDSPKVVIETCENRGIFSSGYHTNQSALAPRGYLSGAEWNWSKVYHDYAVLIHNGEKIPHRVRGGLNDGIVKVSPYGPAVNEQTRKMADSAQSQLSAGSMSIFKGPLKDNQGNIVIAAGKEHRQSDIWLESMDWLVEGVMGTTGV